MTLQRCPKCNQPYPAGAESCPHCAAPLVRVCPTCGTRRPWTVPVCPRCSAAAQEAHTFTSLFQEVPRERIKGRYVVEELIANGVAGRVLRAVDRREHNQPVAIKELSLVRLFRADERRSRVSSLMHQIERWSAIDHPALPRLLDTVISEERIYVVMELVPGLSLAQIIADPAVRATPELARNWGAQLCSLLRVLHKQDPPLYAPFLAPAHVMVTPEGQVKLVGLGLGYFVAPSSYGPYGSLQGYGAPELDEGFPAPRTDVFALGRLLYALLVDRDLSKPGVSTPPLQRAVPGISNQLVKTIARAASKEPHRRYPGGNKFGRALWDEAYGELTPMTDWYQSLRRTRQPEVMAPVAQSGGSGGQGMEAMGFAADPRYGQRPEPIVVPGPQQPQPKPVLSVQPHHFAVQDIKGAEKRRLVLTLRNIGEADVTGRLISHVSWVSGPNKPFTLPTGKQAKVLLSVDGGGVPAGKTIEPQALSLDTNAGAQWIGVSVEVASGPQLVIETPTLDIGALTTDAPQRHTVTISNAGRQPMSGVLATRMPWLRIDRGDFACPPGRSATINIVCLPDRLPNGPQQIADALVIDSEGGQGRIAVHAWRQRPALELGATHMDLSTLKKDEVAERYLIVGNTGDGPLEGSVRSLVPWLQAFPREFSIEAGGMTQITVTADMAGMADGPIDIAQALRVQSNGGTQGMSLHALVSAPRLVVGTELISFGAVPHGDTAVTTLRLSNEGSAPLELGIASLVPWLSVAREQLSLAAGQAQELQLSVDTTRFAQGETVCAEAALRLTQASEIHDLGAEITVVMASLRIEPEVCDFGYVDPAVIERREVTIVNDGNGRLAWSATTAAPWVELAPAEGVCPAGQTQTIALSAYGLMLPVEAEADESSLIINSDGGRAKVTLRIAKAHPLIASDTPLIELGPSVNRVPVNGSLRLFNHGLGVLRGTIRAGDPWLVVSRVSFECATGRSTEIGLSTDLAELPADSGDFETTLLVESNGGPLTIDVALHVELVPTLVVPESVELTAGDGDELEGRLVLRNEGLAPGHVLLTASIPGVQLSRGQADIKPGSTVRIRITATAPLLPNGLIWATCDDQRWTIALTSVQ